MRLASGPILEISVVGKTEAPLTEACIPFEVGISKYEELAKAQIVGDHTGMLKILFHPDTRKVLGVHATTPPSLRRTKSQVWMG